MSAALFIPVTLWVDAKVIDVPSVAMPVILLKFGRFCPLTVYWTILSVLTPTKFLPATVEIPVVGAIDIISVELKFGKTLSVKKASPWNAVTRFVLVVVWNTDLISWIPKTFIFTIALLRAGLPLTVTCSPTVNDPDVCSNEYSPDAVWLAT